MTPEDDKPQPPFNIDGEPLPAPINPDKEIPSLDEITKMAERLAFRAQQRFPAIVEKDYIAEDAIEHWQKDGLDFYIVENKIRKKMIEEGWLPKHCPYLMPGPWNGYVRFPKLPGIASGYSGIYTYVPVHGGLTFFQEWSDGSVTYGFDTGHLNSDSKLVNDINWMRMETESMGRSIRIAARFERYYLKADNDNRKKARVILRMNRFLPVSVLENMGVMLNILSNDL